MTVMDLDQQLAELRSAADAYAARHQFIEDLTWPQGVRIAVNFTCDFDAMLLRRLLSGSPLPATSTIGSTVSANSQNWEPHGSGSARKPATSSARSTT